jgi:CubicO group peptidase (beta-lactamase class C family)
VLRLDDTIDDLVPELANRRVLRAADAALDDTVPARRSITVEDLLTFRLGIGSVMQPPRSTPLQRAEDELCLRSIGGPPWPPVTYDVDGWITALGTLPLLHHPGECWLYNTSAQVLGVVIARATGQPLEAVMRERVLEPLAMHDTAFSVPADRLDRLTTAYGADLTVLDEPSASWWSTPPTFPDGSGMLVSTIDDLWSFAAMLLAGGTTDDGRTRLLSPESVAAMTIEQITPAQREEAAPFLGGPNSWGLGMGAPAAGATAPVPTGFGWEGGSGTTWRTNLHTGVTGILLTQRAMDSPVAPQIYDDFWAGVREATS